MYVLTILDTTEPLVEAREPVKDAEERATSKRDVPGAMRPVILLVGVVGALIWEASEKLRTIQCAGAHS